MDIELLIKQTKSGNKEAQEELFSKLFARYSFIITRIEQEKNYKKTGLCLDTLKIWKIIETKLKNEVGNINSKYFYLWSAKVIKNIIDDHIVEFLVKLSKLNNFIAEQKLFSIIRQKLLERAKSISTETNIVPDDCVHETLLIICSKYKSMDFQKGLLPWAYTILDNIIRNEKKKVKRRSAANHKVQLSADEIFDSKEIEDVVLASDLKQQIRIGLSRLGKKSKKVFFLLLQDYSRKEVTEKLNISNSAMDSLISRGRKQLKKNLTKNGVL